MVSMKQKALEPGLLAVFRWFVAARLVVLAAMALGQALLRRPQILRYPVVGLAEVVGLLILLLWMRQKSGEAYLPFALAIASFGPIIEHTLTVSLRMLRGTAGQVAMADAWQLILVLLIPLILVAWQYGFRAVLLFCATTTALDFLLTVVLAVIGRFRPGTAVALITVRTLLYSLLGYVVDRLMSAQREQRTSLAEAHARLADYATTLEQLTVSRERNRLARELHDTLAHSLSAVSVQLEAVRSLWDADPKSAREMLDRSLLLTREGLTEARQAIGALRADPLEDLGLALALQQLARSQAERAGAELILSVPKAGDLRGFVSFCRTGTLPHRQRGTRQRRAPCPGQAPQPRPFAVSESVSLVISDDGVGFNPRAASSEGHYGLQGMRERAELIGARLQITSHPGTGSTVTVTVADRERGVT